MKKADMGFIEKYDIKFDESYCSYEDEAVTYYFTADKSLIDELFPEKYPEATSSEISIEMPFSCSEARSASVMVSPTLDCDGCATDYDWSDVAFPFEDIEKLLDIAREPVVIIELDCKGSYSRYALTIQEFNEEFEEHLKKDMPGPIDQGSSYTLRPLVHMWYMIAEKNDHFWEKFFTDMEFGLSKNDIKEVNIAHIDFKKLKSLKDAVIDTALRHQEVKILSCEKCPDSEYGKYLVQYQVGTDFISFMFSNASTLDQCIESVKEKIIENLLQNAPLPLWFDLSEKLLDEIVESSFDMHFIEKDDEDWTQATADAILYEAKNLGLSDVVTAGDDCYITIFAAAMCSVNWFGHTTYGVPYLDGYTSIYFEGDWTRFYAEGKEVIARKGPQRSAILLNKLINMMLIEEGMNAKAVIKRLLEADFTREDLLQLSFSAEDVDDLIAEDEHYSRMEKEMREEGIDPVDIENAIAKIKELRAQK